MARIRSCHPQQWTDDDFVTCSPLARLLALGLRNEADDNSIFEWNPTKLKMRILPADNCEIPALLDELIDSNQVWRFEVSGRFFGMIRSFQRFQKPKKPSFQHPTPSVPVPDGYDLSPAYVRKSPADERAGVPPQLPTSSTPVPNGYGNPVSVGEGVGKGEGVTTPPSKQRGTSPPATPESPVVAALSSLCAQHRVKLDARGKAHLAQWAEEGTTPEHFLRTIAIARERPGKAHPAVLSIGYLGTILPDVMTGIAKDPDEPRGVDAIPVAMARIAARETEAELPWWKTADGVQRQGTEMGVDPPRDDESWPSYRARVFAASGHGPWMEGLSEEDAELVRMAA